jgi:hypothetical protein
MATDDPSKGPLKILVACNPDGGMRKKYFWG